MPHTGPRGGSHTGIKRDCPICNKVIPVEDIVITVDGDVPVVEVISDAPVEVIPDIPLVETPPKKRWWQ